MNFMTEISAKLEMLVEEWKEIRTSVRYFGNKKFAAARAAIHNHFNQDRHFNRREIFKQNRAAALAEWCQLAA